MAKVGVNGVDLHHEVDGDGECVVLTHGSWTDATGWEPARALLRDRYRVVVWDRRGHSRSAAGEHPGSRAEDADDLAGLIEHVSDEPVHVVGNSYGGNVTLTLVASRPELVRSAAVHEPPLWGLLGGSDDPAVLGELAAADEELSIVRRRLGEGDHRGAASHFIDHVALGPGTWEQLPDAFRSTVVTNAPTYLDELADETALTVDAAALASSRVPIQLTHGTQGGVLFPAAIARLARLVPTARVEVLDGAGHVPHSTHTGAWVERLVAFHDEIRGREPAPVRKTPGHGTGEAG